LWIQRSTHKPKNLKRKRLPAQKQPINKEIRNPVGKRRKVLQDDSSGSSGNFSDPQPRETVTSGPRAAKLKANKKLDAQAKALAEFQRENALATRPTRTTRRRGPDQDTGSPPPRPSRAIRVSNRLRGGKPDLDEEWQSIPDEWLTDDNSEPPSKRSTRATKLCRRSPETADLGSDLEDLTHIKTGLESDGNVSDLTDLPSDHEGDPHEGPASTKDNDGDGNRCNGDISTDGKQDETEPNDSPKDFIEWEMV
jgi:hypothetical protein